MRILVVEDEAQIARGIRAVLEGDGMAVDTVGDGDAALDWAGAYAYDLVILDIILPGRSGLEVCSQMRSAGFQGAILMLTALDQIDDRVAGLDRGADDYLTKPFAMAELRARVRALRRRHADRRPVITVRDVTIDPARMSVLRSGTPVRLTAREFALLETLAREPGRVFSHDQLIDAVWDSDYEGISNIVEVYVRSLRRKLDDGRRDGLIQTVRGVGYRLAAGDQDSAPDPTTSTASVD